MKHGKFREDLYYRVNTITIEIPPLRERCQDVPLLIEHLTTTLSPDEKSHPNFSPEAIQALMAYSWPGNVRELRNLVEKYCILFRGMNVSLIDLPKEIQTPIYPAAKNTGAFESMEKSRIRELLVTNNWNQSRVARTLNLPLTTLRRKIKKYNLTSSF